jgi:threonine 3-dehydrogenase
VKALVKQSAGPGFVMKDVPEPKIRDDEVLIRVRRAGVCGTDVHIYEWDAWAQGRVRPPIVVGHEFAGEVARVGSLVTDVSEGDRVTAEGHIVDGRCLLCRTGNAHVCPHTRIIGVDRDGCFAEYIAMPATNVWHLDANVSFDIGGIHDPMGNAFHTALTAEIPGASVLITGCGPIGLFAVGICKAAGASRIIATDLNHTRLALAKRLGAHDAIRPEQVSVQMLGIPAKPMEVNFATEVIFKGITIYGVVGRRMYDTWHQVTRFLRSGMFDPSPVITHRFPLDGFDEAIRAIKSGEAGKVIFEVA